MRRLIGLIVCGTLLMSDTASGQEDHPARAFSWRLFHAVAAADTTSNVVLSPTSVALALGLVRAGAAGHSRAVIDQALELPSGTPTDSDPWAREWTARLEATSEVTLRLANSLWIHQGFDVNRRFVARLERDFRSQITTIDLHSMEAVDAINHWASEHTNAMIERMLAGPLPSEAVLALMNATYFKGTWQRQFDPSETSDLPFHVGKDSAVPIPMMRGVCACRYLGWEDRQFLRIPYRGDRFAMYVLLPAPADSRPAVDRVLADSFAAWRKRMGEIEINLRLPRFTAGAGTDLVAPLGQLGMAELFSGSANLSGMTVSGTSPYLGEARQFAIVKVNEEGTEAAAVTIITPFQSEPPHMVVDRPFYFVIHDDLTGTPLFIGRIVDPR